VFTDSGCGLSEARPELFTNALILRLKRNLFALQPFSIDAARNGHDGTRPESQ
jgi:hypothetical protein